MEKPFLQGDHLAASGEQIQEARIENLLPRYYEAHGTRIVYEIAQSLPVDGHDVAWMKWTGDSGITGHQLHCACAFTEGVGWRTDETYGAVGLGGEGQCEQRAVALGRRIEQLAEEYRERFEGKTATERLQAAIIDLIAKDKAGEFIGEGTNGAHFWGGHFYLQTVGEITGVDLPDLWPCVDTMVARKQIQLDGMVVQEYYEPPAPTWSPCGESSYQGDMATGCPAFTITMLAPTHSKMLQQWQYSVVDEQGNLLAPELANIPGGSFMYGLEFGIDSEDVATAQREADELAVLVRARWGGEAS